MAVSQPTSPNSPLVTRSAASRDPSIEPPPPTLTPAHYAAYHTFHRDLCRHTASLPRQLTDHLSTLHTLHTTTLTTASHLTRLTTPPPPTLITPSVLTHFTGLSDLLRVATLQQLDTALSRLADSVATLQTTVDSLTRLHDTLRTAAMSVDPQLLTWDVTAVRELEKVTVVIGSNTGSASKAAGSGGGGSHRKLRPDSKKQRQQAEAAEEDGVSVDAALGAAVSPLTLLLTLEDVVYTLTALQHQHSAALAQLQSAMRDESSDRSEERMRAALAVLSERGVVNRSMLEEWLSIIRRACKS